jgi:hypothetical protein
MGGVPSRNSRGLPIRSPSVPRSACRPLGLRADQTCPDHFQRLPSAMCLDDLPWSDVALIAVIIAVAVLWKSVETFLEE